MNCKDCKYWEDPEEDDMYLAEKLSDLDGFKVCSRSKHFDAFKQYESSQKVFTVDGEDYYSALITAPDFGCVLFEGKE